MKQLIAQIASFAILGLSIFMIWMFFQDYHIIYLVSGILMPIILMLMSSQYCAGNLFAVILIGGGIIGYLYLDEPYKLASASASIYMILFKLFRYGIGISGNYIDKNY